jgi:hypothetical protein
MRRATLGLRMRRFALALMGLLVALAAARARPQSAKPQPRRRQL